MTKEIDELLEETKRLTKENKKLKQQLLEARESIDAIKKGNIDALVVADQEDLKVYTEKTADKTYRVLIEKMHEGAVTLNEAGIILYCNSYFAHLLNLPLQKVIGTKFKNFIGDTSKERFEALVQRGIQSAAKEDVYISTSDGKAIPVLLSVNSLSLDNNFVLSIILTDLTIQNKNQEELRRRTSQLEEKNAELERANKELAIQIVEKEKRGAALTIANKDVKELDELNTHKETILAILSHDLRSPLNGIIGMAEYLKSYFDTMEPGEVKQMIDLLHKSSKAELNMLDYLVEWARIKYASEVFSPTKIELSQYVKKVFETLNENAVVKNVRLDSEIEENTSVFTDGKMLLSVLHNLISNAIKYTPPGGKITATAKRKGDKIITEIKDTGIGISKEIREKLFTPQMDLLSNARKENKGAGIGLLLVKGFLEKNGGEIWVESREGEGSSFYFTLPVDKPSGKIYRADKMEFNHND